MNRHGNNLALYFNTKLVSEFTSPVCSSFISLFFISFISFIISLFHAVIFFVCSPFLFNFFLIINKRLPTWPRQSSGGSGRDTILLSLINLIASSLEKSIMLGYPFLFLLFSFSFFFLFSSYSFSFFSSFAFFLFPLFLFPFNNGLFCHLWLW